METNWQKMLAPSGTIGTYIWNFFAAVISKPQLFRLHKWCGLFASLLIITQAATGAINAFRYEAGQIFDPAGMVRHTQSSDAPLSQALRSLRDAHPEKSLERIVFPKGPRDILLAHLLSDAGEKTFASLDPGNAKVLRSGNIWAFPTEAAAQIHYNLTIGLSGIFIVAVVGVLCLFMATTGFLYWWPRKGQRAKQLSINWRAPKKLVLRQLHRSTGIIMSVLLSFSLITGLVLAIDYVAGGINATTKNPVGLSTGAQVDIDAIVRQARSQFPDRKIRDVRFVDDTRADIFVLAPERSTRAVHQVGIDLDSRTIVVTANASANTELWVTWLPLHSGEFFGSFGLTLIVSNALALFLLAASGPIMWFNRVRLRRTKNL